MGNPGHNGNGTDGLSRQYADRQGDLCARVKWTPVQRRWYALVGIFFLVWLAVIPYMTWVGFSYLMALTLAVALGVRLVAILATILHDPTVEVLSAEVAALRDEDLPLYSVMVPLHREPEVVPSLLQALEALDYPREKLDVQLLLEPEDQTTLAAIRQRTLPPHIRVTLSPGGFPQTKPRACNAGLENARGEFTVVYDAEDRPEPDQLKKVLVTYRKMPAAVVCLQCRLAHYNSMEGLFAQWSAMEYLVWYRLLLPGLQWMGAPIPLGGTSNHFRTEALRKLGGWDPFNVTEDCDLGMRIARTGGETRMLASTTWEESVTGLRAWVNQHSRWLKGYWQTWLVHSRRHSLAAFGLRRWVLFFLVVGCSTLMLLVNPVIWVIMLAWLFIGWPMVDVHSPVSVGAMVLSLLMMGANGVFLLLNVAGCLLHRRAELVPAAVLSPLEWVFLSAAAWKGFVQFFTRPFHWEKTAHGVSLGDAEVMGERRLVFRALAPTVSLVALTAGLAVLFTVVVLRIERQIETQTGPKAAQLPPLFAPSDYEAARELYGFEDGSGNWVRIGKGGEAVQAVPDPASRGARSLQLTVRFPGESGILCFPRADWSGYKGFAVDMRVPSSAPQGIQVMFYLRDRDRLWYQCTPAQRLLPGEWARVESDLRTASGAWRWRNHAKPWGTDTAQHVRELGVRVMGRANYAGPVYFDNFRAIPYTPEEWTALTDLRVTSVEAPAAKVERWGRFEATFSLTGACANPFDPEEVDAAGVFGLPDGSTSSVPAFYFQEFTPSGEDAQTLTPAGAPCWKVRFAPWLTGPHTFRVRVRDRNGREAVSDETSFPVVASSRRGFVRVSERDPRYLRTDDGTFFYPLGHNVCWPVDEKEAYPYEFPKQRNEGIASYRRFFEKMNRNGENWARVWMMPGWLGLEGNRQWDGFHGVGRYNQANAWRLDRLLELAERNGIVIQLTVNHHSEYKESWWDNAYSLPAGGPCARAGDLLTNVAARRLYRNRLRYLVGRWGYSPHIMAWELWGEVNLLPGFDPWASADWHKEMGDYLAGVDPWKHLVFTHCHNWQNGFELWALPQIRCVQGNGYIRPPNRTLDHVVNFRQYLSEVEHFRKPVFVAEYGGRSELGAPSADYLEAQLHSGIWASLVHPFGGAAMNWWWNFVDGKNLYFHFRPLSAFAKDLDRLQSDYQVVTPQVLPPESDLRAAGMQGGRPPASPGEARRAQGDVWGFYWVYHRDIFARWENLPPVTGATMVIPEAPAGTWRVETWDTVTGEVTDRGEVTASDGRVEIPLPAVKRDLAVKLRRGPS